MTQPGRPAVFVHGLWLHASSWGPWLELFQEAGYAPTAPGWPGDSDTVEESRRDPSRVAGKGINDVVDHYAGIIRGLEAPPVVIGHSFGGLIAQRLLGQNLAAAAVAIDAAPIKGVLNLPVSALKVASIALLSSVEPLTSLAIARSHQGEVRDRGHDRQPQEFLEVPSLTHGSIRPDHEHERHDSEGKAGCACNHHLFSG